MAKPKRKGRQELSLKTSPPKSSTSSRRPASKNKIKIFLSHKVSYRPAALNIRKQLEFVGKGRIEVFVCEDIPAAVEWRDVVIDKLKATDYFLLLFTDPIDRSDWCLYETGFFDGRANPDGKKKALFVIHHKEVKCPDPLSHWQSIVVDANRGTEAIKDLLARILKTGSEPICPELWENQKWLDDTVQSFLDPFFGKEQTVEFDKRMSIHLTREQALRFRADDSKLLPEVKVTGYFSSLTLFGFTGAIPSITWKDFVTQLDRLDHQHRHLTGTFRKWADQLVRAMSLADRGLQDNDGLPLLRAVTNQTYRPSLYSLVRRSSGAIEFNINLTTLPTELVARPIGQLGTISHAMDLCRMFRWGVLESQETAALRHYDEHTNTAAVLMAYDKFETAMRNIQIESANRGLRPEDIVPSFGQKGLEVKRLIDLYEEQKKRLETAMKHVNFADASKAIGEMLNVNTSFYRLTLLRFAELFASDFEKETRSHPPNSSP